jgi:hypothetical protein
VKKFKEDLDKIFSKKKNRENLIKPLLSKKWLMELEKEYENTPKLNINNVIFRNLNFLYFFHL